MVRTRRFFLESLNQYDKAIFALRRAVSLSPEDITTWYTLGQAYYLDGRPELMLEVHKTLSKLDKKTANVFFEDFIRSPRSREVSPDIKLDPETRHIKERRFYENLTVFIPKWRKINENEGFLVWLQTTEPLSGRSYQQLLDDAAADLDVNRVAAIFKTWPKYQK